MARDETNRSWNENFFLNLKDKPCDKCHIAKYDIRYDKYDKSGIANKK